MDDFSVQCYTKLVNDDVGEYDDREKQKLWNRFA